MPGGSFRRRAAGPAGSIRRSLAAAWQRVTPAVRRAGLERVDGGLFAIVLAGAFFYEWTAHSSIQGAGPSYYWMLAGSFLHLHTFLPIAVPKAFERLSDPYNPVLNSSFGFHDLAYHGGHLYLTWLPTPVLALYLPARLLGIELADVTAIPMFSISALVFAVLLLRLLVRRYLPATPKWMVLAAACVLAFGTAVPFVLRRPAMWEVAVTSGACFMLAALYLLARGLDRRGPRLWHLALASLCCGLAIGARPSLLPGALFFIAATAMLAGRRILTERRQQLHALALLGPITFCLVLIALYNIQRFGSPTDVGLHWQLAGAEQLHYKVRDIAWLWPGMYDYLLAPPRIALTFPHIFLMAWPHFPFTNFPPTPASYTGVEPTGGVVPTAPIVLFIGVIGLLWRRRSAVGEAVPLVAAALAVVGLITMAGVAVSIWGTTERYEVDFDIMLILAGLLAWMGLYAVAKRRRLVAILGAVAALWSCVVGVAISLSGYENLLDGNHPALFAALEDITSPLATLATMVVGHPVIARVQSAAGVSQTVTYTTLGAGMSNTFLGDGPVTIVVDAPGSSDTSLTADIAAGPTDPTIKTVGIIIRSPGRRPSRWRETAGSVALPVHLHWGLNRIVLTMAGPHPVGQDVELNDIVLHNAPPSTAATIRSRAHA